MGRLSLTLMLSGSLVWGIAAAGDHPDRQSEPEHERAWRLLKEGRILPLEELVEQARAIRPGRLLEAELESKRGGFIYELEIVGEDGHVWELEFNAETGELMEQKLD